MTSIEALVNRQLMRLEMRARAAVPKAAEGPSPASPLRVITISRQTGSGGHTLAERVARMLNFEFVDRQILDYIVQNTGARDKLITALDEQTRSGIDLWVDGILAGRYVDRTEYNHWLVKSVTAVAGHGEAVILGRAGNVILAQRGGLHVRIIAARELRVANLVNYRGMSLAEAQRRVMKSDNQRRDFYRENFGAEIDNAMDYHLVINTGRISLAGAEEMVLAAWKQILSAG